MHPIVIPLSVLAIICSGLSLILEQALSAWLAIQAPRNWLLVRAFSIIGDPAKITPVLGLTFLTSYAWARHTRGDNDFSTARQHRYVFWSVVSATCLSLVLKAAIGRERPATQVYLDNFVFNPLTLSTVGSFPSAHAAAAAALVVSLVHAYPNLWKTPLFVIAALLGAARITVGQHWVSDVIIGWMIGFFTATLIKQLLLRDRRPD